MREVLIEKICNIVSEKLDDKNTSIEDLKILTDISCEIYSTTKKDAMMEMFKIFKNTIDEPIQPKETLSFNFDDNGDK